MHELSWVAEKAELRTVQKDRRKSPDIDLFAERIYPTAQAVGTAALRTEATLWRADEMLLSTLWPKEVKQEPRASKRNGFWRKTKGLWAAFSRQEMNDMAFDVGYRLKKSENPKETYEEAVDYWIEAATSVRTLNQAVDPETPEITLAYADRIRGNGLVREEMAQYLAAQTNIMKNSWQKQGSVNYAFNRRLWEYCFDAASDQVLIKAWVLIRDGQEQRLRDWGKEIAKADQHTAIKNIKIQGLPLKTIKPKLASAFGDVEKAA